jgi:hypothetical protein
MIRVFFQAHNETNYSSDMFFSEKITVPTCGEQKIEGISLAEQYWYKTHRDILLENAVAVGSLHGELHAVSWSFKSWKRGHGIYQ